MFERLMNSNEVIGLTMMLLLVMALVASQADATIKDEDRPPAATQQIDDREVSYAPLTAIIEGHINGKVLTISIDTVAEFGIFRIKGN